jgi:hypothetical protein
VSDFLRDGYVVLPALLGEARRAALHAHALAAAAEPGVHRADPSVPDTPVVYGDPVMDALLEELIPRVEAEARLRLYPTYSYYRVYGRGAVLPRHTDREACEVSLSVCLGYAASEPWPLWVERHGQPRAIALRPGDALMYRGIEVPHWREAFAGDHAAQLFLHYVDQTGPYQAYRFDQRPSLFTRS